MKDFLDNLGNHQHQKMKHKLEILKAISCNVNLEKKIYNFDEKMRFLAPLTPTICGKGEIF